MESGARQCCNDMTRVVESQNKAQSANTQAAMQSMIESQQHGHYVSKDALTQLHTASTECVTASATSIVLGVLLVATLCFSVSLDI